VDIGSIDEVLSTTRAVRRRLDLTRPVEREVILECLQLAMQAPTASNEQNWRWMVITDADKRAAIAEIYRSVGQEHLAKAADTASDPQTRRVYESANALTGILADVPVHVIPCIERRFDGSALITAASAWASIIPAGWSFMLALRSRLGVDHAASGQGARGRRVARHTRHGDPGGAVPGGLHHRHRLQAGRSTVCGDHHVVEHLGRLMHSYTVTFAVHASPQKVWRVLHPPAPTGAAPPRIITYPAGSMEILTEGDEAGQGLVRTCVFDVPRYLLSGGKARSWETVTEAKMNKVSRYVSISKPLWSRAEGYHELDEQPDGTTLLIFHETYHAYNPLLRALLERRVHAKISADNLSTYEHALSYAGPTRRVA
jgi:nitroreductase